MSFRFRPPGSLGAVIAISIAVAACGSSSPSPPATSPSPSAASAPSTASAMTSTAPPASSTTAQSQSHHLVPASSQHPAAGVCAGPLGGRVVTVHVDSGAPAPRCLKVRADQHLRVVDRSLTGRPQRAVTVTWPPYRARKVASGASTAFARSFGSYLAPGVHDLKISPYAGGPEIWLVGGTSGSG